MQFIAFIEKFQFDAQSHPYTKICFFLEVSPVQIKLFSENQQEKFGNTKCVCFRSLQIISKIFLFYIQLFVLFFFFSILISTENSRLHEYSSVAYSFHQSTGVWMMGRRF